MYDGFQGYRDGSLWRRLVLEAHEDRLSVYGYDDISTPGLPLWALTQRVVRAWTRHQHGASVASQGRSRDSVASAGDLPLSSPPPAPPPPRSIRSSSSTSASGTASMSASTSASVAPNGRPAHTKGLPQLQPHRPKVTLKLRLLEGVAVRLVADVRPAVGAGDDEGGEDETGPCVLSFHIDAGRPDDEATAETMDAQTNLLLRFGDRRSRSSVGKQRALPALRLDSTVFEDGVYEAVMALSRFSLTGVGSQVLVRQRRYTHTTTGPGESRLVDSAASFGIRHCPRGLIETQARALENVAGDDATESTGGHGQVGVR